VGYLFVNLSIGCFLHSVNIRTDWVFLASFWSFGGIFCVMLLELLVCFHQCFYCNAFAQCRATATVELCWYIYYGFASFPLFFILCCFV